MRLELNIPARKLKLNIPDKVIGILLLIVATVFVTLTVLAGIEYYEWLNSASCDDVIESLSNRMNSIAVKHSLEVKIVELECWK